MKEIGSIARDGGPDILTQNVILCWAGDWNCHEPIIENNMVLRSDCSSGQIENQGGGGGALQAKAHKHALMGVGLTSGEFLSIGNRLFQYVSRRAPNMAVMEAMLWPTHFGEKIRRTNPCVCAWHAIIKESSMVDGHGPQTGVGNVRPMNTRMEHCGASHRHYSLYGSFSDSILVMGTYTSEGGYLVECLQMFGVFGRGEG